MDVPKRRGHFQILWRPQACASYAAEQDHHLSTIYRRVQGILETKQAHFLPHHIPTHLRMHVVVDDLGRGGVDSSNELQRWRLVLRILLGHFLPLLRGVARLSSAHHW